MTVPRSRLARLGIDFPFMVGPMVGLSHVAFRELIRSYLPPGLNALVFTEMLSTRRLPNENLDEVPTLKTAENERFYVPQLLGNEERFIGPSVKKLLGKSPWGFDINMGCPVSHILKHNWGIRLMGDSDYAADVVRITKRYSPLPVSVKLRSGFGDDEDESFLSAFTEKLEKAGADWMTLHCRPKGKVHNGEANWNMVAKVARERSIPVVANGDIQTADDALSLVEFYGADGAMIGRAATARPWILGQIAHRLGHTESRVPVSPEEESQEYFRACLKFIDLLERYGQPGPLGLKRFHFFVVQGSRFFMFGHAFWKATMKAKSLPEAREIVEKYASSNVHPFLQRVQFS